MYDETCIDTQKIGLLAEFRHPGIEEDATAALDAEFVQVPLLAKGIVPQGIFPALHFQLVPWRMYEEVAVARAYRAVARDELLLGERRRQGDGILDGSTVAARIVGLRVCEIGLGHLREVLVAHFQLDAM